MSIMKVKTNIYGKIDKKELIENIEFLSYEIKIDELNNIRVDLLNSSQDVDDILNELDTLIDEALYYGSHGHLR